MSPQKTTERGPKHPALFVAIFFALGVFLIWLFPNVETRTAACSRCGAVITYQFADSPISGPRRFNERITEPLNLDHSEHDHDFSDFQVGGYANIPRWRIWQAEP